MNTMNRSDLLTYLKQAIDLETAMLAQRHIISTYDASAEKRKPVLNLIDVGNAPDESNRPTENPSGSITMGTLLIMLGIGCLALLFFMADGFGESAGIMSFLTIVVAIACIGGGCAIRNEGMAIKDKQQAHSDACTTYNNAKEQAAQDNALLIQQHANAMQAWNISNTQAHAYLNKFLSDTEAVLQTLYAKDIIYPKYRTLPALTSIYEYLITGRCEELTGPHGAYNLYEDEIRKDTVISQLNTVIENLEKIRQNQYMLYEQVKGIQQATRAIAVEMYQIKGYTAYLTELTALNTYYNGINAMNSTALAYCRSL